MIAGRDGAFHGAVDEHGCLLKSWRPLWSATETASLEPVRLRLYGEIERQRVVTRRPSEEIGGGGRARRATPALEQFDHPGMARVGGAG